LLPNQQLLISNSDALPDIITPSTPITEQSPNNDNHSSISQHVSTPTVVQCYNLKCLSL